jgi:hypothetical protein
MPREKITTEAIAYLKEVSLAGGKITGCNDKSLETLKTCRVRYARSTAPFYCLVIGALRASH